MKEDPIINEAVAKIYKPQNQLRWTVKKNVRATYYGTVVNSDQNSLEAGNDAGSYQLTVAYEGPVNLPERNIRTIEVPNYWYNPEIIQAARTATGIEEGVSCGLCCLMCCAICTCVCLPCALSYKNKHLAEQASILQAKVNEIACGRLAQDIAGLFREADPLVTERLRYAQSAQSGQVLASPPMQMAGSGNIVMSMEQLQALLRQQQTASPQMTGVMPAASAPQPMMMSPYPAQPLPPYPLQPPATQQTLASATAAAPTGSAMTRA